MSALPPTNLTFGYVRRYRSIAAVLIVGTAVLRIIYLLFFCPLDLSPDEAHYWDWSRHLDWSYYSKGPLVAWLIRLSCVLFGGWSEALTGSQMAAVRLPAVVCGALLLASLYVLTAQVYRNERAALLVVCVALTMPVIAAGSLIMTIDAPYTCCWGWALILAHQAIFQKRRWAWSLLGVIVGLGILAKYTMILFFPSFILFLLFTPGFRRYLLHPSFWFSLLLGAICCIPIVWWNIQHDWVAFLHVRGHAGLQPFSSAVCIFGPFKYVSQQFALLLGYWFILWILAMWRRAPWHSRESSDNYLWWFAAPMFLFFLLFAFFNDGGNANWPVTAYLSGIVLTARWLLHRWQTAGLGLRKLLITGVIFYCSLGAVFTVLLHRSDMLYPLLKPLTRPSADSRPSRIRRVDPTCRLRGWQRLAKEVDRDITRLRYRGIKPILTADRWNIPGLLGFYCRTKPQAHALGSAFGDRHSQYDLWRPNPIRDPDFFRDRSFIYIGDPRPLKRSGLFQRIERTRQVFIREKGHLLGVWQITVLHGFSGFAPTAPKKLY